MKWIMILSFKMVSLSFCLQWGKYLSSPSHTQKKSNAHIFVALKFSIFRHCKHAQEEQVCTEYSIVRTIRLKNSLMPHKHLKRQNVIQLHHSSDLNSNKAITECLTDKTRHVTAARCVYNLHHGRGVELEMKVHEDFTFIEKAESAY